MSRKVNYSDFGFSGDYVILCEKKMFSRTSSGKGWKKNPDQEKKMIFTPEKYNNALSFVPVLHDRVEWSYTTAGYLPVTITSTCPDGSSKAVFSFEFLYRPDMTKNAGWLEKEVLKNATTYTVEFKKYRVPENNEWLAGGMVYRKYITFINENDTGITNSATYEVHTHSWH